MKTVLQSCQELHFPVLKEVDDRWPVIQGDHLLDQSKIEALLKDVQEQLKLSKLLAAGSLFGARYGQIAGISLFLLSCHQCMYDLSLRNQTIQYDGKMIQFMFHGDCQSLEHLGIQEQRERVFRHLLEDHLTPVFQSVSRVTRIPLQTLWSHTSFLLHFIKNRILNHIDDVSIKSRVEEDFRFLIKGAPPHWFGMKKNPLDIEFKEIPDLFEEGKKSIQRHRCCLKYLSEGGRYCYTCPSLGEEERKERRREYKNR
ncbi:MAG: hypothetical protein H0Z32_10670 [Bacillaceae bacterium]|nr:hypothetical protein [Bacillaceae bacterium]